jgi:hypothetical protein
MTSSAARDPAIPRYLRYKAEEKSADDYWDVELERVNSILHSRVMYMKRDGLCTGCARFDWLRRRGHTREAKDERYPIYSYSLSPVDDVQWEEFDILSGVAEDTRVMAQHPLDRWEIDIDQPMACVFCKVLVEYGTSAMDTPPVESRSLSVTIDRDFPPYACRDVSVY